MLLAAEQLRRLLGFHQAELKVGDKLSDFPDYYRVLPAADGASVALSKFLDKSPVTMLARCAKPCMLIVLSCYLTPWSTWIAECVLSVLSVC